MEPNVVSRSIEKQDWLEPVADTVQGAVRGAYEAAGLAGTQVKDFLHGTWMGHPLHVAITDIPVGSWTAAMALDAAERVTGNKGLGDAADIAVGVGLIGAVGSAVTGITDWHVYGEKKPKRMGMAHAMLNTVATGLYTASWFLRKSKKRDAAQICSGLGYLVVFASAYLGGTMIYEHKVGVDHAERDGAPDAWTPVLEEAELVENQPRRVQVEGMKVLVVKQGDQIYAIGEVCSHYGGPLAEGSIEGNTVRCPWHGSRFSLADGSVVEGPAVYCQSAFDTRVREGKVEIRRRTPSIEGESIEARSYMA